MKKVLTISVLSIICVALIVFGTFALITSTKTAENVISTSNLKIATVETGNPSTVKVVPASKTNWTFAVKNTGKADAYVRVKVSKIIELAQGVEGEPNLSLMQFNFNDTEWTYNNGYYYYNEPLASGETTENLFTKMTFSKNASNKYQEATAKADIFVSATQVKNNGTNVFDASGWVTNEYGG